MLPLLGFAAPRHMPGRRIRSCARLPASHRATSEVWSPPSRRPPPTLRTPLRRLERPRASPFKAFSSHRSDPLSGASALWAFHATRGPLRSRRRSRLQGVDLDASSFRPPGPEGPDASMPSWVSSLQSVLSLRSAMRFDRARLPHHALGGLTSRPACVSRCCGAEGLVDPSRGYRLAWVSPPSDRHSATRAVRRAGVWIRLTDRARCKRHDPIQAPSLRPDQSFRPGPALPSFGERLLPLPFVRAC
jgi:hypothetical protein